MIDYTEILGGDAWEAFSRDYFGAMDLVVAVPPGRGPDGGRDILIRDQLRGRLGSRSYTWLVSCKHYAASGKSVGTDIETNITDRLNQHQADGFIGFYSTQASAALIDRLKDLREQSRLDEFRIFDGTRIENGFHDIGLSSVMLQHLPLAHTSLRPIHPLLGEYQPLECEICGKDLLRSSISKGFSGILIFARNEKNNVEEIHFACKGSCDKKMSGRIRSVNLIDAWDDIDDYCNPLIFIRSITGYINQIRDDPDSFSAKAHKQLVEFYIIVSQRTLRQTNTEDRNHFIGVQQLDYLGF